MGDDEAVLLAVVKSDKIPAWVTETVSEGDEDVECDVQVDGLGLALREVENVWREEEDVDGELEDRDVTLGNVLALGDRVGLLLRETDIDVEPDPKGERE